MRSGSQSGPLFRRPPVLLHCCDDEATPIESRLAPCVLASLLPPELQWWPAQTTVDPYKLRSPRLLSLRTGLRPWKNTIPSTFHHPCCVPARPGVPVSRRQGTGYGIGQRLPWITTATQYPYVHRQETGEEGEGWTFLDVVFAGPAAPYRCLSGRFGATFSLTPRDISPSGLCPLLCGAAQSCSASARQSKQKGASGTKGRRIPGDECPSRRASR